MKGQRGNSHCQSDIGRHTYSATASSKEGGPGNEPEARLQGILRARLSATGHELPVNSISGDASPEGGAATLTAKVTWWQYTQMSYG